MSPDLYKKRLLLISDDLAAVETVPDLINVISKLTLIRNEMNDVSPTEEEAKLLDWLMGAVLNLRMT